MVKCKNCKYWERYESLDNSPKRECCFLNQSEDDDNKEDNVFFFWTSIYDCEKEPVIYTGPEFGCTKGEKKP